MNGEKNGVYTYTAPGFPNLENEAANYWVDVVFSSSAALQSGTPGSATRIWPDTVIPTNPNQDVRDGNNNGIQVGVKFRTEHAGKIAGVRFYKGILNTGPHTVHLWDKATGSLLATATAATSGEGWRDIQFSTPVSILPNTTYIASYYSPSSYIAMSSGYFNVPYSYPNWPLRTLYNTELGENNGVYVYGTGTVMPTNTYGASNYWVDVMLIADP